MHKYLLTSILTLCLLYLPSTLFAKESTVTNQGTVSYYGKMFHGRTMANGKVFDMHKNTVAVPVVRKNGRARPKYPFGTILEVTNLRNNKSIRVTVTDTGSFSRKYGRVLDLSRGAFEKIADRKRGVIKAKYRIVNSL